jgi:hypothetical protein
VNILLIWGRLVSSLVARHGTILSPATCSDQTGLSAKVTKNYQSHLTILRTVLHTHAHTPQ